MQSPRQFCIPPRLTLASRVRQTSYQSRTALEDHDDGNLNFFLEESKELVFQNHCPKVLEWLKFFKLLKKVPVPVNLDSSKLDDISVKFVSDYTRVIMNLGIKRIANLAFRRVQDIKGNPSNQMNLFLSFCSGARYWLRTRIVFYLHYLPSLSLNRVQLRDILDISGHFEDQVFSIALSSGWESALKTVKLIRLAFTRALSGSPINVDENGKYTNPGIRLDREGFPKFLCFSHSTIKKRRRVQIYLTLLTLSRSVRLPVSCNLHPITDPPSTKTVFPDFLHTNSLIEGMFTDRQFINCTSAEGSSLLDSLRRTQFRNYHFSVSGGPSGKSMYYSLQDVGKILQQHKDSMHGGHSLIRQLETLGGKTFKRYWDRLTHNYSIEKDVMPDSDSEASEDLQPKIEPLYIVAQQFYYNARDKRLLTQSKDNYYNFKNKETTYPCLRKLHPISDKEGKTRIVAMFDYFSQTVLQPYHDSICKLLRILKYDCTFNQGSFIDLIKDEPVFHSLDLSNATDRLPALWQKLIFRRIFGLRKSMAWYITMVGFPFHLKLSKNQTISNIQYKTGQPMGAYSSWPMLALTHHLIVYYSYQRVLLKGKKKPNMKYCILGDDIIICDDDIATEYRAIMSDLDVPISYQKTHVSKDTCEFAKRWLHQGHEVSPYPCSGFVNSIQTVGQIANLIITQRNRGYELNNSRRSMTSLLFSLGLRRKTSSIRSNLLPLAIALQHAYTSIVEDVDIRKYSTKRIKKFLYLIAKTRGLSFRDGQLHSMAEEYRNYIWKSHLISVKEKTQNVSSLIVKDLTKHAKLFLLRNRISQPKVAFIKFYKELTDFVPFFQSLMIIGEEREKILKLLQNSVDATDIMDLKIQDIESSIRSDVIKQYSILTSTCLAMIANTKKSKDDYILDNMEKSLKILRSAITHHLKNDQNVYLIPSEDSV